MNAHRPFFITAIGFLATLAAIWGFLLVLQMLGLFPLWLGEVGFYGLGWLGATLWGIQTLLTIWSLIRIWGMDPGGWLLMTVVATMGILLSLFSIGGGSTLESMLPSLILYGLSLLFLLFPHTREASSARPYA